jgi:Uracil DNA glycosylase superfamily
MPYIAPIYGGQRAELLCLFRDPARTAMEGGLLCLENDDASAERLATLLEQAGIPPGKVVGWNAYPWYINRQPTTAELDEGIEPLLRVIALLTRLKVVMLMGGDAQRSWRKLTRLYPEQAARFVVLRTYHTSREAFIGSAEERRRRRAQQRSCFTKAARLLG